jgi:cation diffusion facilitator family transporter
VEQSRKQRQIRITLVGLVINGILAVGKLAAGILGHSHALVADAVESFSDLFSSLIVWRGVLVAAKPPDADHPYGHGKAEPLTSALIAGMLLTAAAGIAVHSIEGLFTRHDAPARWTLFVLVVVIVIKEVLFRLVRREALKTGSLVVRTDAWHHRSDAITSLAAAVGIGISLWGGPRYAIADEIAALVAAGIIAWSGWMALRPALQELMDTTPDKPLMDQIQRLAESVGGVEAVGKCHARRMGWNLTVDMHVSVDPEMRVREAHQIAHAVEDFLRERMPEISSVLVHVEPAQDPSAVGIAPPVSSET